jgi:hypothetical protein
MQINSDRIFRGAPFASGYLRRYAGKEKWKWMNRELPLMNVGSSKTVSII